MYEPLYTASNYKKVETPEQAWELNQKKANAILGGGCWLRLGRRHYQTLIDLSGLGLDQIEEAEDAILLGAMVTLRQLETSPLLKERFGLYFVHCTRHIVGVQFRNCATLGGSVAARFGFSDIVTALLALDCQVELVKGGWTPLAAYVTMPPDRDVLLRIRIRLTPGVRAVYESMRNSATDLPVLTCALSQGPWGLRCAIGGRSGRPAALEGGDVENLVENVEKWNYVDNMRASGAYRRHLAGVLLRRANARLEGGGAV